MSQLLLILVKVLNERPDNKAPKLCFQTHLEDQLSYNQAKIALNSIIVAVDMLEYFFMMIINNSFSLDNPT